MSESVIPVLLQPQSPVPSSVISDADYLAAAAELQCEVACIKAVSTVETGPQGAFDLLGRPTILFERHVFSHLTNHIYDASQPDISNPVQGGYGKYSEQYPKILRAAALNLDAALSAASWGEFQIMGENYKEAGYASVEAYVTAMRSSIESHLEAFVQFIKYDPALLTALRAKQWAQVADIYNGPGYKTNNYDGKLAAAYAANS